MYHGLVTTFTYIVVLLNIYIYIYIYDDDDDDDVYFFTFILHVLFLFSLYTRLFFYITCLYFPLDALMDLV